MTNSYFPDVDKNVETFINEQRQKCEQHNIVFNLVPNERVAINDIECNGYFYAHESGMRGIFTVATGKPFLEWFPTFIHESSHVDQFIEKSPYWFADQDSNILDDWINGIDFDMQDIKRVVHRTILLEADCEARAVEKIKQFNLPVNIEEYSRQANSYLLFHHWMLLNRKWYTKAPYEIEEIVRIMNPSIMKHIAFYLNEPNKNIMKAFNLCG